MIQSIHNLSVPSTTSLEKTPKITPFEAQKSFGAFLKDAIHEVNSKQIVSDEMTNKLIQGGNVELHDVMIAAQKATIALNATIEIRNKVVEAYQEIIRMPV